ncbi:hypothetical protein BU16DRAFT_556335 [Lophium mytilinum]|uniref:RING-type domain-containing protein n=1 Tax=Lophium mytilinum TaxID=390894 RepID=A0A6A6RBM1_9PEZI|nr:hypothetical protein BU16DRAFT_556335 [Lophium mytilinum]
MPFEDIPIDQFPKASSNILADPPDTSMLLRESWLFSNLRLAPIDTIKVDDRICSVCLRDITGNEMLDQETYHKIPVRANCGHAICQFCLVHWLNIGKKDVAVSIQSYSRLLKEHKAKREEKGAPAPGLWGSKEKKHFNIIHWHTQGHLAPHLFQEWMDRHKVRDANIVDGNDRCPMCRSVVVPWIIKVGVIDVEKACTELSTLLTCFFEINPPRGTLPAKSRSMLEPTIAVALMKVHGSLLVFTDAEDEIRKALLKALEEVDYFIRGLPELDSEEKVRQFKLAVNMFLRFLTSHVVNEMPWVKVKQERPPSG